MDTVANVTVSYAQTKQERALKVDPLGLAAREEFVSGFHRHSNGGGLVADTAFVDTSAYVGPNATVTDEALIYGNARILDEATQYWWVDAPFVTTRMSLACLFFGDRSLS